MNLPAMIALIVITLIGVLLLFIGKIGKRIGLFTLTVVACAVGFFAWKYHLYEIRFEQGEIGFTQEQIRSMLGKPTKATDCTLSYGSYRRGEYDHIPSGCAEEYWYYSFFTPEAWSYSFDGEKKLIEKYHWVSP